MQIGEVAEHTGLSLRTIRYYEEVGLAAPSARSAGGFRLYSRQDLQRLQFLKKMKPAGLQLEQIRELLQLLDAPAEERSDAQREKIADMAAQAEREREKLAQRIATVDELLAELREAIEEPNGN